MMLVMMWSREYVHDTADTKKLGEGESKRNNQATQ